ncbi:MAG: YqgE/AlgH family protein [Thermoguttaceae bacterium]
MKSLKGHFLVASSHLLDPNFVRTVVLLVHHTDQGAFGVVLNRPAESTVEELWQKVGQTPCHCKQPFYVGGPVSGPLMAIHADPALAEMEVLPGVYFAAQRDHLEKLIEKQDYPFRIFVGHSGWGEGQLENELEQGAWLTTPASPEYVFYDDFDLWRKVTQQIGRSLLMDLLKLKGLPEDPTYN